MKKRQMIEKETIKVAWDGRSSKILYSKMFNSLDEAVKFSKNKKYFLIFKLIMHKRMKEFEWEILNYGKAKEFTKFFDYYRKI